MNAKEIELEKIACSGIENEQNKAGTMLNAMDNKERKWPDISGKAKRKNGNPTEFQPSVEFENYNVGGFYRIFVEKQFDSRILNSPKGALLETRQVAYPDGKHYVEPRTIEVAKGIQTHGLSLENLAQTIESFKNSIPDFYRHWQARADYEVSSIDGRLSKDAVRGLFSRLRKAAKAEDSKLNGSANGYNQRIARSEARNEVRALKWMKEGKKNSVENLEANIKDIMKSAEAYNATAQTVYKLISSIPADSDLHSDRYIQTAGKLVTDYYVLANSFNQIMGELDRLNEYESRANSSFELKKRQSKNYELRNRLVSNAEKILDEMLKISHSPGVYFDAGMKNNLPKRASLK